MPGFEQPFLAVQMTQNHSLISQFEHEPVPFFRQVPNRVGVDGAVCLWCFHHGRSVRHNRQQLPEKAQKTLHSPKPENRENPGRNYIRPLPLSPPISARRPFSERGGGLF